MKLRRRILPIGGSKAVTLPAPWLRAHGLKCGDVVEVSVDGHEVVVRPLAKREPQEVKTS